MTDHGKGYSIMPTVQKLNVLKVLEEIQHGKDGYCPMCSEATPNHEPECKLKLALGVLKAGISE